MNIDKHISPDDCPLCPLCDQPMFADTDTTMGVEAHGVKFMAHQECVADLQERT